MPSPRFSSRLRCVVLVCVRWTRFHQRTSKSGRGGVHISRRVCSAQSWTKGLGPEFSLPNNKSTSMQEMEPDALFVTAHCESQTLRWATYWTSTPITTDYAHSISTL